MHFSLFNTKHTTGLLAITIAATLCGAVQAAQGISRGAYQNWQDVVKLVSIGDKITLDPTTLQSAKNVQTVEWRQDLSGRKADYVQTVALVSGTDSEFINVFVQTDRVDDFLANCGAGTDTYCRMTVGKEFQFGDSKNASSRFLVFHDTKFKPYRHRFVGEKTYKIFSRLSQQLVKKLGRDDLKSSLWFPASQYASKNRKIFGGDIYLKDIAKARAGGSSMAYLARLSPDLRKAEFIDRKSRWCYASVNGIFGKRGELSDGTIFDPGKLYMDRCINWERNAWLHSIKISKSGVTPEMLLRPEVQFRACLNKVENNTGHRAKGEQQKRKQLAYACALNRKLGMVSMGADPNIGIGFAPGPALNKYFASGKWRLN